VVGWFKLERNPTYDFSTFQEFCTLQSVFDLRLSIDSSIQFSPDRKFRYPHALTSKMINNFFIRVSLSVLLFQLPLITIVSARQPKVKSFAEWCEQKSSVSAAAKITIDALLEKAGTKNCQQADSELKSRSYLDLSFYIITDVEPLSGLVNLTSLEFCAVKPEYCGNRIRDLKPLSNLINLQYLGLSNNQSSDFKHSNLEKTKLPKKIVQFDRISVASIR
jgi:hypothetical protein